MQDTLQVRPCKLDGALLVCAVLRTRQDRGGGVLPNPPEACLGPMAPTVLQRLPLPRASGFAASAVGMAKARA